MIQQDLVILLDSTQSIEPNDYQLLKTFIKQILSMTKLSANQTRAAMISFSDENRVDFDFDLTDQQSKVAAIVLMIAVNNSRNVWNNR